MICFQISIFEPLNTAFAAGTKSESPLWFAFKLVSLSHWIQQDDFEVLLNRVVICFQISIFEPLNTAVDRLPTTVIQLWFAFKLVSLSHWIQLCICFTGRRYVVICFQISIFEPLNTASVSHCYPWFQLWFAFKLVSLSHWIQLKFVLLLKRVVVICFQISIFEPLNTARR